MPAEEQAMTEQLFIKPMREALDEPARGQLGFLTFTAQGLQAHTKQYATWTTGAQPDPTAAAAGYRKLLAEGHTTPEIMYAVAMYAPELADARRHAEAAVYGLQQAGYNGLHAAFALSADDWEPVAFESGGMFSRSLLLGGYAAAHVVNTMKDSREAGFTPLYLTQNVNEELTLHRLANIADDAAARAAILEINRQLGADLLAGAYVTDGYYTFPQDSLRMDALLVTCYEENATGEPAIVFAVPYVPRRRFAKFKLYRTKVGWSPADFETQGHLADQFFAGIDLYPDSEFWDRLTDDSR